MPACENCGENFPPERWMKMGRPTMFSYHIGSISAFCNGCRVRVKAFIPWHVKTILFSPLVLCFFGTSYFRHNPAGFHLDSILMSIVVVAFVSWEVFGQKLCYRFFGKVVVIGPS